MPDALHLKPEEIDTVEKRGKYTVSVVGCGQKGVNYSLAFAEAGFKVLCTDADQSVVRCLSRGKTPLPDREVESKLKKFTRTGMLTFTSDAKNAVTQSDIIIVTIGAKIDAKKNADYSEIENSCKQVGAALQRGRLVIYVGIASLGLMEGIVKETLENTSGLKVGEDLGLAYNPALVFDDRLAEKLSLVSAIDKNSLNSAAIVLAALTGKNVRQIPDFKTIELATLFALARRDANIALSNEFAMLCETAGVDYFETMKVADGDFLKGDYAPTVTEEAWTEKLYLLLESAENLNVKLKITELARHVNEGMARYATIMVQDALRGCGKTLRRARVTLLGITRAGTSSGGFVKMLEAKGAKISLFDPLLTRNDSSDTKPAPKRSLSEAVEGSDCIVILTADSQFKRLNFKNLRAVMRAPAAIIDLARIIDPEDVEKEGFIYRGLGRGSEKK